MSTVERGTARSEGVIEAGIDHVWALITDLANMDWWGNDLADDAMIAGRTYLDGEEGCCWGGSNYLVSYGHCRMTVSATFDALEPAASSRVERHSGLCTI